MIKLNYERYVQRNVGTALRPEWEKLLRPPVVVVAECDGIRERGPNEPVHFFERSGVMQCLACSWLLEGEAWTDDAELYMRHPMRCNYACNLLGE